MNANNISENNKFKSPPSREDLGGLYLVPSPIGNLADITFRAVEILKKVDLILAEDTRTSSVLLRHYNIEKPVTPYHKHNKHKVFQH